MTTLPVNATEDFTGDTLSNIDLIQFGNAGQIIATFASDQFGPGEILNTVTLDGGSGSNAVIVNMSATGTFSADQWGLVDWTGFDQVQIFGTSGADTIIGTDGNDQIGTPVGTQNGADSLLGGDGDDLLRLGFGSIAGAEYQGGSGFDTILLQSATTYDLSATTIGDVERININQVTTAVLDRTQIGVGKIATIAGSPGGGAVQALVVNGSSVDLTGVDFVQWEAIDTITINGTSTILNTLVGSDQKDTIGGTGNSTDFITGGDGADTLNGGGGADFFRYLSGGEVDFETVNGGDGDDTIRLENTGLIGLDAATITGVETLDFFTGNSTAILAGDQLGTGKIDAVSGSSGVDALVVTTDDDELTDLSDVEFTGWTDGTDTITILGTTGDDTLFGSAQADTIEGESGADAMSGGGGNDTYVVDVSNDSVNETAGEGTDLVQSSTTFTLADNVENLTLTGTVFSSGTGNAAANVITGNSGGNTLAGLAGNDTLAGGGGADTASYAAAAAGVTVALATTTAQNTVGDGTDTLSSMENLIGSGFADTLSGSSGDNTVSGGGGTDNVKGFSGNDFLLGDAGDDTLNGGANDDVLNGGHNNDTLIGQDGNDTLVGGNGTDTASYIGAVAGVRVALSTTTAQDAVGDGTDTLSSMENLIGSNFTDTLSGSAGDNTVSGGGGADNVKGFAGNDVLNGDAGDDTLNGGANTDTLNGGENNDTLIGQDGNDTLNGGNGTDTASYVGAVAGVTVSLATTTAQNTVGDGTDTLSSVENLIGSGFADTLSGTSGNNTISGGSNNDDVKGFAGNDILNGDNGDDTLNGGANDDTLNGGENNDTLIGQDGNDTLAGGNGVDTASYVGAVAGVTVSLATTTAQNTVGDGTDTLSSIENVIGSGFADTLNGSGGDNALSGGNNNDTVNGFSGLDVLNGDNGNDTLNGGANNDTLNGGANDDDLIGQDGDDTLTGGSGLDDFIFDDAHGADTVTDFQNGSDRFNLTAVTGIDDIGDLTITDNGATVTVNYGSGSFTITNLADPASLDSGDFIF